MFRSSSKKVFLPTVKLQNALLHRSNRYASANNIPSRSGPTRSFSIFTQYIAQHKLSKVKEAIDGSSDERKVVEYLSALSAVSPRETITSIERGWENGKLPKSEPIVREYLKAAAALQKLDTIDIAALFSVLNKSKEFGSSHSVPMLSRGQQFSAGTSPTDPLFIARLEPSWKSRVWDLFKSGLTMFLVLAFAGSILDEKGGGIGGRMGANSSIIHQAEHSDKSFDDVVGIDEAKYDLQEIVMYLKNPKVFTRLGGRLPKGILLTGPPGTGKTLLARAIAGEAGVPFFYTSGSEFEEMYVGVGARRVRDLFEAAKNKSPCIIFIDEIDAIGGSRHVKEQSAMKMTLNQLLVEMDGFEQNNGVIVIAATNFPDSLDNALVRPGRFDKHVDVPMPDIGGRKAILELYGKKVPMGADVDMEQIARGTPGFSGAELFNLINQAALKASVDGLKSVGMQALEYAKDKIMMGSERKSAIISPETMKTTAFHEAGHALVALRTDGADPIHKATIMPRGRALGMVMQLPDGDQTSMSRKQMLARLDVCMGGRVAEELVFGHDNVTSGASSDIQQATRLATAMVTQYGLSDKIGILFVDSKGKNSGKTQTDVDEEVRQILADSYARATHILTTQRADLDKVAKGLLEYESLSGGEIVDLLAGKAPNVKGLRSQRASRSAKPLPPTRAVSGGGSGSGSAGIGAPEPAAARSTVHTPTAVTATRPPAAAVRATTPSSSSSSATKAAAAAGVAPVQGAASVPVSPTSPASSLKSTTTPAAPAPSAPSVVSSVASWLSPKPKPPTSAIPAADATATSSRSAISASGPTPSTSAPSKPASNANANVAPSSQKTPTAAKASAISTSPSAPSNTNNNSSSTSSSSPTVRGPPKT